MKSILSRWYQANTTRSYRRSVHHQAPLLDSDSLEYAAHGGSYSIYYALAVASKEINIDHR
jgi:hypothetical protein